MMAGLDQVPLWPRDGRWGEWRASDGADGPKAVFVFLRFCLTWRYNKPGPRLVDVVALTPQAGCNPNCPQSQTPTKERKPAFEFRVAVRGVTANG